MPIRLTAVLLTTVVLLAGCSYLKVPNVQNILKYPNVHKVVIRQGNIIDQEMIDQLRPGLTRSQVRYILGTPLIADSFNQSRWDYYYSIKVPGLKEMRERVSIYFSEDKLSYFTGDYLPSSVAAAMKAQQTSQQTLNEQPGDSGADGQVSTDSESTPEAHPVEPSNVNIKSTSPTTD
jgi:outer membrane protein assembly factor BamE